MDRDGCPVVFDFEIPAMLHRVTGAFERRPGKLARLGIQPGYSDRPCMVFCLCKKLRSEAAPGMIRVIIEPVEMSIRLQQGIGYRNIIAVGGNEYDVAVRCPPPVHLRTAMTT